ncbi:MAG TPA: GTA-gp10 family protein [Parvularculaceae bacterium]|nr:GTA-gp10 family protein [Parvularculaceae bacterium]
MTQHRKGDAAIVINGEPMTLRLTLGALAALEETLGQGDFAALQKKLEAPRVSDLLLILQALLQGGGRLVSLDALKTSDIDLADAARAIADAFKSLNSGHAPSVACGDTSPASGGGERSAPPFTGKLSAKLSEGGA